MFNWIKRSKPKKIDPQAEKAAGDIAALAFISLQNMEKAVGTQSSVEFPGGFEMISNWVTTIQQFGALDQAEAVCLRQLEVMEKFYGRESKILVSVLRNLQELYKQQQRPVEESTTRERADEIAALILPLNDPAFNTLHTYLSKVISCLMENLDRVEQEGPKNASDFYLVTNQVIAFSRKLAEFGRLDDAEQLLNRLHPMLEECYGNNSPQATSVYETIQGFRYAIAES